MASEKLLERIEDAEVRDQLMQEAELANRMTSTKSAYERKIEALLQTNTDPELDRLLNQRLEQVRSSQGMDIEEAIEEVTNLGLDPVNILRQGLQKHINGRANAAIRKQEGSDQ